MTWILRCCKGMCSTWALRLISGNHAYATAAHAGLAGVVNGYAVSALLSFPAHRALPDVEALVELFTQTALVDLLSSVPTRTARQQLLLWRTQKEERGCTCSLLQALGKRVTVPQAKGLATLHLMYPVLRQIRSSCASNDEFQKVLWQ